MLGIGAWRRPWIVAGLLGWAVAIGVHAAAMRGADLPDAVGWALFVGVFPPFLVAVFTHPRARVHGARARIGPIDSALGAWPPYIALALGSFVYVLAISHVLGVHHVALGHHLAPREMSGLGALVAAFFAISTMLQSSARALEQLDFDPGP